MPETIEGRFEWALEQMRDGFYVTNLDIEPLGYGVCIDTSGGRAGLMLMHYKRQCQMPWIPTAADILRSDWRSWEMPNAD